MSPFYHPAAHRFAAPGGARPGSAPSPPPRSISLPPVWGHGDSRGPLCHGEVSQGTRIPGAWHLVVSPSRGALEAFPSPACDWGHVTSRSPPWCPCGIRDAPVWLPGKQQGPKIPPRGMQGLWARSPRAEQAQPCPHPDVAVGCTAPHPPGASVSVPVPSPCPSVPSPGPWCHRWHWNIPACTPGVREGWWRGEGDLGVLGPLGAPL